MYWSDVYSDRAAEALRREEAARVNLERRIDRAKAHGSRHSRKQIGSNVPKVNARRQPQPRRPRAVTASPKRPGFIGIGHGKAGLAVAVSLIAVLATGSFGFAAGMRDIDMMPEPTDAALSNVATDTAVIDDKVSGDSNQMTEVADSAMTVDEEVEVSPVSMIADVFVDVADADGNAVVISSADVNHDGIWQNVSAYDFTLLDQDEKIEMIGAMAHDDEIATGIPAELTAAQMILESGWMESGLTQDNNNCFGIKASSGGYNWEGSTWDGDRVADMVTQEEYEVGEITTIVGGFRVYDSVWDSVRDHSAYLLNSGLYPGIAEQGDDIARVLEILTDGGYATGSDYADEIMNLIEMYDLSRFGI